MTVNNNSIYMDSQARTHTAYCLEIVNLLPDTGRRQLRLSTTKTSFVRVLYEFCSSLTQQFRR